MTAMRNGAGHQRRHSIEQQHGKTTRHRQTTTARRISPIRLSSQRVAIAQAWHGIANAGMSWPKKTALAKQYLNAAGCK